MTGVLMAVPPADFVLHNSLFLIAHFHNVIIGGVVFGCFAGLTYWFPKAFGFRLHEGLGKAAFWCWFFGFYLAFMPLYILGFMGMTRRMKPLRRSGMAAVSARRRMRSRLDPDRHSSSGRPVGMEHQASRDVARWRGPIRGTDAPWSGQRPRRRRSTTLLRFRRVGGLDAYWEVKQEVISASSKPFEAIEIPKNSGLGFFMSFFAVIGGVRHDLAHLVDGCTGAHRVLCADCMVVLGRKRRIRTVGRRSGPARARTPSRRLISKGQTYV